MLVVECDPSILVAMQHNMQFATWCLIRHVHDSGGDSSKILTSAVLPQSGLHWPPFPVLGEVQAYAFALHILSIMSLCMQMMWEPDRRKCKSTTRIYTALLPQ